MQVNYQSHNDHPVENFIMMIATCKPDQFPRLVLSYQESDALQRLLDQVTIQSEPDQIVQVLLSARDHLDYLHAIATWLREDVVLDLPSNERDAITELLQHHLPDHVGLADFPESTLNGVREKMFSHPF
jgi:hypothetical protein